MARQASSIVPLANGIYYGLIENSGAYNSVLLEGSQKGKRLMGKSTRREGRATMTYTLAAIAGVWIVLYITGTANVHDWEDFVVPSVLMLVPIGAAIGNASEIWYRVGDREIENDRLRKTS